MKHTMAAALVAIAMGAGCGPESAGPDGSGGGVDSSVIPPGLSAEDVVCVTHTKTTLRPDGSSVVARTYYALLDVSPTQDYYLETCNYSTQQPVACEVGSTCTETGVAPPSQSETCYWSHRSGSFANGKLVVTCGFGADNIAADGQVTQIYENRYQTIRLHR